MSQSPIAAGRDCFSDTAETTLTDATAVDAVLGVLDDADCRAMLEATDDTALSAQELAEACDLAQSTTYRKVEMLDEAGLLDENIRIKPSGKHTSEYSCAVDDLTVDLDAEAGLTVTLSHPETGDSHATPMSVAGD
ncbi:helix-turn-helix domain-containing protein [Halobacteriales archaeon Cl-PHB]